MDYKDIEIVVGLEIHVQLKTDSKMFCGDANVFGAEPNTNISTISLAHPGTLPKTNKKAIECGVKLAYAIGAKINAENRFDRKHYYYADLPKGYQITQNYLPICEGGYLEIDTKSGIKKIRFHHIHMEEDAGKSIHTMSEAYSYLDLNRAGVPLLEIVTKPDLRSGEEVQTFIAKIQQLVRYLDISDGNMEEGSLRCDCNVSIRKKGETLLNERCEIKNLNSKKFAKQAVENEAIRQFNLLLNGETIINETMHYDPQSGKTTSTREKEGAHDYRYLPDPDLPPVILTKEYLDEIKNEMPKSVAQVSEELVQQYGLTAINAQRLAQDQDAVSLLKSIFAIYPEGNAIANMFINKLLPSIENEEVAYKDVEDNIAHWAELVMLIDTEKIASLVAYQKIFPVMLAKPNTNPSELAKSLQLFQSSDEDFLNQIIAAVIAENPDEVEKYINGKKAVIGFLIGQGMKMAKGKANPKILQPLLIEAILKLK